MTSPVPRPATSLTPSSLVDVVSPSDLGQPCWGAWLALVGCMRFGSSSPSRCSTHALIKHDPRWLTPERDYLPQVQWRRSSLVARERDPWWPASPRSGCTLAYLTPNTGDPSPPSSSQLAALDARAWHRRSPMVTSRMDIAPLPTNHRVSSPFGSSGRSPCLVAWRSCSFMRRKKRWLMSGSACQWERERVE
jgi:hypothetical protein